MAVNAPHLLPHPRWPSTPFDPARARVHDNPPADELVVHVGARPRSSYVDWIAAPETVDLAVLVASDPGADNVGEIVGIQVDHLLARAAARDPSWRALAEPSPARETVAQLVRQVATLFTRYGVPAPDDGR